MWDAATGQPSVLTLKGHTRAAVTALAFSPDGTHLARRRRADNTDHEGGVGRGQRPGGVPLPGRTLKTGGSAVAFSPDGKRLASAADDNTVKVWDAAPAKRSRPSRAT